MERARCGHPLSLLDFDWRKDDQMSTEGEEKGRTHSRFVLMSRSCYKVK